MPPPRSDSDVVSLLRQLLAPAPTTASGTCPSAEELAALVDGGLSEGTRQQVLQHLSQCPRCFESVGLMVRVGRHDEVTSSAGEPAGPSVRGRLIGWLGPPALLAAAALAWMIVRPGSDTRSTTVPPTPMPDSTGGAATARSTVPVASAPPLPRAAPASPSVAMTERAPSGQRLEDTVAKIEPRTPSVLPEAQARAGAPTPSPPAVAEPGPGSEPRPPLPAANAYRQPDFASTAAAPTGETPPGSASIDARAKRASVPAEASAQAVDLDHATPTIPVEVFAAGGSRWRVRGSALETSRDSGRSWVSQPLPAGAVVLRGVATSGSTCWLVGRAGLVLHVVGDFPTPIAVPTTDDIVGIAARSDSEISILTTGGTALTTIDAGRTWQGR